jgi:thiol-disulfide isomerase/thioredoxin
MKSMPAARLSPRLLPAALFAAITAMITVSGPALSATAGQPAPDFKLPGISSPVQLSAFKGQVVYLDFWASWCGPCKKSFPWMNEMQSRYGARGLKVIAVNVDTEAEDWKKFLQSVPARFDIALDPKGAVAKQYEVKGMPTSLIIDGEGKVLAEHQGFNEQTRNHSEQLLQSLLGDH